MRALNSSSPLGWGGTGARNKSGLARGKDGRPGGAGFPFWRCEGPLRRRRASRGGVLRVESGVCLCRLRKRLLGRPRASCGAGFGLQNRRFPGLNPGFRAIEAGAVVAAGAKTDGLVISLTGSNRSIIILTILLDSLPRR